MPLRAYRHDAGWLLGRTFLEFVHTGRKTGRPYETVAMVLRYDADAHEAVICAAWGPETDWVRNLRAGPPARMRIGRLGGRTHGHGTPSSWSESPAAAFPPPVHRLLAPVRYG
jgi:deazaflavin-dependent oxidoreductase (nitroreductase family)